MSNMFGDLISSSASSRNNFLKSVLGGSGSKWSDLTSQIEKTGVSVSSFEEKFKEVARSHGIAIDDMIKEEGSLANVINSGKLKDLPGLIKETFKSFMEGGLELSGTTKQITTDFEHMQEVVRKVIKGDFGNGAERINAMAAAGENWAQAQALVDYIWERNGHTWDDCSLTLDEMTKIIGNLSDEELKKHNFKEFIHPDDAKLLNTVITNSLGDEKKYAGKSIENLRIRLRDARYGWQWYELFGFFTSFRAKAIFCCSFFPINEQIRIHEELIEHKRLMNILLNNSWAIVWKMACLSRRLTLLTPVSKERFGIDDFPAGPIISNVDVFTPESLSKIRQELNERIASLADSGKECDSPQRSVITVQNKDGSRVDLEICSTLEKNDIGFYTLYGVSQLLSKNELSGKGF